MSKQVSGKTVQCHISDRLEIYIGDGSTVDVSVSDFIAVLKRPVAKDLARWDRVIASGRCPLVCCNCGLIRDDYADCDCGQRYFNRATMADIIADVGRLISPESG